MILLVGNRLKLGGLCEVFKNRYEDEELIFIEESISIKKQENEILRYKPGIIVYDCNQYYDTGEDIALSARAIARATKAISIFLVPTDNPKNEIVKNLVLLQLKNIVNSSLTFSGQKDQLEKILAGYYEANEREDISIAEREVKEETQTLNDFVGELYEAKQREEEKENTIIIQKKGTSEVLLLALSRILKTVLACISIILVFIALVSLTYTETREPLFLILKTIYSEALRMIGL